MTSTVGHFTTHRTQSLVSIRLCSVLAVLIERKRDFRNAILSDVSDIKSARLSEILERNCLEPREREMTQMWKDSERQSTHRTVLEVIKSDDGTYLIVFNVGVIGSSIPEEWPEEELCTKRGFCGEELPSIKRQCQEFGRAVVIL